ncbi:energy transducer TonB [Maricaulis sp.]|uniref:energy transducer TonB n=1 Tax=Maricaulis sp. TaxID=1486257 RepID=UPI0026209A36|nr:energy transducer TonB [Maricaulis sp.]
MKMNSWVKAFALSGLMMSGLAGAPALAVQDAPQREAVRVSAPDYPRSAERRGLEGYVVIAYDIDESGDVVDATVAEAQPEGVFDRAALRAVNSWRFAEAAAVTTGHQTRLNFALQD